MTNKQIQAFLADVWEARIRAQVPLLSAGLAYYTAFALAPLLLIITGVGGLVLGQEAAQDIVLLRIEQTVGEEAAEVIGQALRETGVDSTGLVTTIIGGVTLLAGATGVFFQLRNALNVIWQVDREKFTGFVKTALSYLFGLGIVLFFGVLLVLSFVANTILSIAARIADLVPLLTDGAARSAADLLLSGVVLSVILMLIYRLLPATNVAWKDVIPGALLAGIALYIVRILSSSFIGRISVSSPFTGAAGALAVILIWIYISARIVLLGAVVSHVYAQHFGSRAEPTPTPDSA